MKNIFLGPVFHWLILIALIAGGWIAGKMRLHVSEFNPFIIALILVTILILLIVFRTSAPGQRITRDPIVEPDDDPVSSPD